MSAASRLLPIASRLLKPIAYRLLFVVSWCIML